MTSGRNLNLVFCIDDRYAAPLATALRSALRNLDSASAARVFVVADGVSDRNKARIRASLPEAGLSLEWLDVDGKDFDSYFTLGHVSRASYLRFIIGRLLPADVDRVLYLDADLVVLGDLRNLWELDLQGRTALAARDGHLDSFAHVASLYPDFPARFPIRRYFNAGVLVLDLKRWRTQGVEARLLKMIAEFPKLPFSDQDVLNAVLMDDWEILDPRWNFFGDYQGDIAKLAPDRRPLILHYVTREKPWIPGSLNPHRHYFLRYLRETDWGSEHPWGHAIYNRALFTYRRLRTRWRN